MGISGFNGNVMSSSLLPILIINAVLTVAAIKHAFTHLLRLLGLLPAETHTRAINNNIDTGRGLGAGLARLVLIAEDIQSNPAVTYLRSGGSAAEADCAVCLSAFQEGEEIRKLPCCHGFHRMCLERWLHDRAMTCPLCRASLVPEERMRRLAREEQELAQDVLRWFSSCNGFRG